MRQFVRRWFYTRLQMMTFIPVAVVLLLLCPVFLGASTSAQLEEIDSVIIHEADMKDIGKFFGSKLIFLKKLTFYVEGSHKLMPCTSAFA